MESITAKIRNAFIRNNDSWRSESIWESLHRQRLGYHWELLGTMLCKLRPQNSSPTKSPGFHQTYNIVDSLTLHASISRPSVHSSWVNLSSTLFSSPFSSSALSFKLTRPSDFTPPLLNLFIPWLAYYLLSYPPLRIFSLLPLSKIWLFTEVITSHSQVQTTHALESSPFRVKETSMCFSVLRDIYIPPPSYT